MKIKYLCLKLHLILCVQGANKLYQDLVYNYPGHKPFQQLTKLPAWQASSFADKSIDMKLINCSFLKRPSLFKDEAERLYKRLLRKRKHYN